MFKFCKRASIQIGCDLYPTFKFPSFPKRQFVNFNLNPKQKVRVLKRNQLISKPVVPGAGKHGVRNISRPAKKPPNISYNPEVYEFAGRIKM